MPEPNIQKIGKYEIQAELGQGGFGRVYRAFDPTVGRLVAIKILTTEGNPDLLTRFRNEATAAGNLRHKNIVTVYEFGEHQGQPFLAMEFLEGEDLLQVISSARQLTLLEKINIMDQVADGLQAAHHSGVVHRDVKPANIRLLPDGTVKIMDFGIARVKRDRDATRLTQQGDLIGTILYMSPEQFGGSEADALCDIFAFGVTYFELLTGKHPFRSPDPRVVMFKITMEDPEPIRDLAPDCPEGLEQILNRALQKDRELRYQSLADLRADAAPLKFELEQTRAKQLVAEAQQLSGNDPHKSLALVHAALNLDPSNSEAQKLRENFRRQIQKDALTPRIEAMLASAEKHVASRSFAQAIQTLESALKLDQTNDRVRAALEAARAGQQKNKAAAALISSALTDAKRGNWPGASEKGREAQRLDPASTDVTRVLEKVEKHVQDVLSQIDGVIAQGNLDAAIAGLKDLAVLAPESREIERRLAEASARKVEADRLQTAVLEAQHRIDQSRFGDAIEGLTAALSAFPDEPGLLTLRARAKEGLHALQRSQRVEQAVRTTESLLPSGRFDEALQEIGSALELYPNDAGLTKLRAKAQEAKAAWERKLLVQATAEKCNRLRAGSRFAEALEAVQAALEKAGEDPELLELRRVVRTEQERQQRTEAVIERTNECRQLLDQGRIEQAIELLRKAATQYPDEQGLKQLLAEAQQRLLAEQRREAVEKTAAQARGLAEKEDFAGAVSILEKALKTWPGESVLADLLRQTQDAHAQAARRRAVLEVVQRCEELAQGSRFAEALEAVRAGLRKYAEEPDLLDLQGRLEQEFERHQRVEAVRQRTEDARQLLEQGRPELAFDLLRKATIEFPEEEGLKQLRAKAGEQALAQQRQTAVEAAAAEAQLLARKQDYAGAIESLEKSLKLWPDEGRLMDLLRETREDRQTFDELERLEEEERELRRRAEAAQLRLEEGRRVFEQEAPALALEALRKVSSQHPEEEGLKQLLATAQERVLAQQRREATEKALAEAQPRLERRDFEGAAAILEKALKSYPDEPRLADLLQKVRDAGRAHEERQRAVAEVVQQCEQLAKGNRHTEALQAIQAGLKKFGDEPALVELRRRMQTERERQQRAEAVRQKTGEARRLMEQGRPGQAVEVLQKASSQYPEEPELTQLLAEAQQSAVAQQRREGVEKAASQAEARTAQQDFQGAIGILEKALKSWAGESRLVELLQKTRDAQAHATRLKVEKALAEAQAFLGEGRIEESISLLRKTATQHPGEARITDLLQRTEEELRQRKRAQELDDVQRQAEALLAQGKLEEAIAAIESRFAAEARFAQLLTRAKKELAAKRLEQVLDRANALRRENRFPEALQFVEQGIGQYGAMPALAELKKEIQNEIELRKQWESREFEHARLVAIEAQVQAKPRKRALMQSAEEVRNIAATYSADREMVSLAARINQQIELALAAPPKSKIFSRKAAGIGAAAALGTIGLLLFLTRKPATVQIPVEIRSDPQGASVTVGDHTCVTPACRFDLPPGTYQVEARLNGYTTAQKTLNVDAAKRFGSVDLTMQPVPAAAPPPPAPTTTASSTTPLSQPAPATGTLAVRAGIPGALVFVDNVPRGRTDAQGALSLPLEAATHQVRVEKIGYQTPREQRVKIAANASQTITLNLTPQPAKLELRNAPAGIEVRAGGTSLGRTDGSGTFSAAVQPGDQTLQITAGSGSRQVAQRFEPGQTVTLDWQNVAPAPVPPPAQPATPPPPDPRQVEAQDWERVRTSNNADSFDDFLRRHADGAHAEEARTRAAQLRQQVQAAAARQAEQAAWDATDKSRKAALQDFLSRYPNGAHVQDARGLITGIDKQDADALAATQRLNDQKDKAQQRASLDTQAISRTLSAFEAAYNGKDLKAIEGIWTGMSKNAADAIGNQFRDAKTVSFQIRPTSPAAVNGDSATVTGTRMLALTMKSGQRLPVINERIRVTLERANSGWLIREITPY